MGKRGVISACLIGLMSGYVLFEHVIPTFPPEPTAFASHSSGVHAKIAQSFLVTVQSGQGVILSENIVEVDDPHHLHDPFVSPECITPPSDGLYNLHAALAWTTLVQSGHRAVNVYRRRGGVNTYLGGGRVDVPPNAEYPPVHEASLPLVPLEAGDCVFVTASQSNALGSAGTLGVVLTSFSLIEQ